MTRRVVAIGHGDFSAPEPPVSGAVVLEGSGFGSKSTPEPFYFQTFEEFAEGTAGATTGLDSRQTEYPDAEVTLTRAHSGTRSLGYVYTFGESMYPALGVELPGGLDLYIGHWVWWEVTSGSSADSDIFKINRGGGGAIYSGEPRFYCTIRPNSSGTVINGGDTGYVNGLGTTVDSTSVPNPPAHATWQWVEFKYRLSTPGVADGFFRWLCNNGLNTPSGWNTIATRGTGVNTQLSWVSTFFDGMDQRSDNCEYEMFIDETIIDTTFSRVIATDNETYASSTKWAPQKPTAWSDTEITIEEPNWSDLTPSSTAYFHVFDADDNHVSAHAVTVPS